MSIYFEREGEQQEIRRISNNGEGWDYDPYFGEGYLIGQWKNVSTLDRANINQRAYVWTSEDGPPYTIFFEREKGETKLNREPSLTNTDDDYTYSRRIGIRQGNSILSFQVSDPLFNTNAKVPIIKLPKVIKDSLIFSKMLSYLTTSVATIPQDVDSIKIDIASYSKGSKNLQ